MITYKKKAEMLERRLKHLLQSDFIASFDRVDPNTKEYIRDIRDADMLAGSIILFKCDGERCRNCHPDCKGTTNIRHAMNFKETHSGVYEEQPVKPIKVPDIFG